ncbi:hypothetical protein XELAEV_18037578mg [Xenopus laevis]|uniref:Uncharacterized protein n=1 Tax=Xenopus laevis TaxID=8355 RepID=A0A974HAJ5_XENLA|nr:hypothetical protein XELAEV_18037578mg [Xenopus laevis]
MHLQLAGQKANLTFNLLLNLCTKFMQINNIFGLCFWLLQVIDTGRFPEGLDFFCKCFPIPPERRLYNPQPFAPLGLPYCVQGSPFGAGITPVLLLM